VVPLTFSSDGSATGDGEGAPRGIRIAPDANASLSGSRDPALKSGPLMLSVCSPLPLPLLPFRIRVSA